MASEPQDTLLGSYFEWLVLEHNKSLCAADTRLRTTVDPAERTQARASLHRAEQWFRRRLNAFPAAVYTTDADGGSPSTTMRPCPLRVGVRNSGLISGA